MTVENKARDIVCQQLDVAPEQIKPETSLSRYRSTVWVAQDIVFVHVALADRTGDLVFRFF